SAWFAEARPARRSVGRLERHRSLARPCERAARGSYSFVLAAGPRAAVAVCRAGGGDEAPVVVVGTQRQPEDAVGQIVDRDALGPRQAEQHRIVAPAAGADDEGTDALERREPLVVVVVAGEDDVGTAAAQRRPQRGDGGVRAVQAGAEARVVHVRNGAGGRVRSE